MSFRAPPADGDEASVGVPLIVVALAIGIVVLTCYRCWRLAARRRADPLEAHRHPVRRCSLRAVVVIAAESAKSAARVRPSPIRASAWRADRGVIVASAVFGAGHRVQGADAAVATAILGAFWAVTYLRRRSVIAPVVSHSGFNLLQLLQFATLG